ncbi:hypothetical protein H5410_064569 [Solanum commersonii]|uniref:Isopentenyltransferase n=1 Tax=Solanum commersonii TaxID=4109 RepID=A0A9J5VZ51_SOLCO|nr:hypothetical protein H5410_064569 [Solanum commersonii]
MMITILLLTKMNTFINNNNKFNKKKVVFIMGATERKISYFVSQFLGEIEPDSDITGEDFCLKSIVYIEIFLNPQCVPIIVGGSNSYIEKLVEDPVFMFKYKYDSCFIWIDVEQSVLNRRVDTRVDEMVNAAKMNTFIINNNKFSKKKVMFVMGATRTGKSRLSVDLATHFRGEIINSDKMQVYKGLDVMTNKITHAEKQGVRHYLLGLVDEVPQILIQMHITPKESDGPLMSLKWPAI